MFTYFDPITTENLPITEDSLLYLIKLGDDYSIRGVSEGLNQLIADPSTKAAHYWPIKDIKVFLID